MQDREPTSRAYVVLSHPINRIHGIFSRGTRVCLAVSEAEFDSGNITAGSLRALKMSWQLAIGRAEIELYQEAITRNGGQQIEHLAKVIAGGSFKSSLQRDGRFIQCERTATASKTRVSFVSPLPLEQAITESNPEYFETGETFEEDRADARELQWILFEDVGKPLHAFVDIMEPIQALCDALEGVRLPCD